MLSYQHIYHAGCLADLHKHAALCVLLQKLTQKPKPLTYIETHAGRGLYDMRLPEARKTGEAALGYDRLFDAGWFAPSSPYMVALKAIRDAKGTHIYPGSAALAAHFLRSGDVMHLHELHPQEIRHLQSAMDGTKARILHKDGYQGLLALAPPTPRRGLVFIDPSFEIKSEYAQISDVIAKTMKKWPVAVLCLWYPLLPSGAHHDMIAQIKALNLPKTARFETEFVQTQDSGRGMYGSGIFLIKAPFGCDEALQEIGAALKGTGKILT